MVALPHEAQGAGWEASQLHFLYRQFFVTPPAAPSSIKLSGQTGIVTGSNVGLGLEASRQLLNLGLSTLILAVRDETKGHAAKASLEAHASSKAQILVWRLDMASYASIQDFAKRCAELPRLDFAILNAGVFNAKFAMNKATGHDEVVQVNYLSTALLTLLLLPVMKAKSPSGPGRISVVSSETASWAKFAEQNAPRILPAFTDPKGFDMEDRYYTSKLLEELFLSELASKVSASDAVVNAVNPGFCYGSGLHRQVSGVLATVLGIVKRATGRSTPIGARTLVDAAVVQGPESHGKYLGDCTIKPMAPIVYTPKGQDVAKKLWAEMEAELAFVNVNAILASLK